MVDTFPHIEHLHLFGAPGTLGELAALAELPKLEALWLCDLFGYAPEEFPAPGELPALTSLTMDSVPANVAAAVRKGWRKVPRIALSVRKPRARMAAGEPRESASPLGRPGRHPGRRGQEDARGLRGCAAAGAQGRRQSAMRRHARLQQNRRNSRYPR